MGEFAMGFFTCLIGMFVSAFISMVQREREEEIKYLCTHMLENYIKYGGVILMTKTNEATEEANNAVFVKNEKWFWRVFKEFNRWASKLFDDKTVKANISAEVDCFGKKQFKYYFESIEVDREN